jgi:ethanolamine ammonia-lyase small subunit
VALGRAGESLPTKALLEFMLDHARARDAVHAAFDVSCLISGVNELGLEAVEVCSRALERKDYLGRPDLGRSLDQSSRDALMNRKGGTCQVAIAIGDGLSPMAVNAQAVGVLKQLVPRLAIDRIDIGAVVIARQARVALGDEIGALLGARMMVVLIGERPGLSAADSLGAYLTFAPKVGRTDAERNCVSNIHGAGLDHEEAAFRIAWLIREGLAREVTGIGLKYESGERKPLSIANRAT